MKKESLFEKHIALVEAVNNSRALEEHLLALVRLRGFRDGIEFFGVTQLIDCDLYYLNRGIERPMCGGVFIDWQPED